MKAIWKYPLKIESKQTLEMPGTGPKLLSVQMQAGVPCLWAVVEPNSEQKSVVVIDIVGTGHILEEDDTERYFLGTVQQGGLVWHVFRRELYS